MEGRLIKIDRNGSKHFEGMVKCDRCDGVGIFFIGVCNGQPVPSHVDNGVCFKCGGIGKVEGKWIERTPEYEAKLAAKRAEKLAKKMAEEEAEREAREAERKAREEKEAAERAAEEARIKAEKAISQHVGNIGDKIEIEVTYLHSAYWTTHMQWLEMTMYAHTFKDANGNVLVWKTQSGCAFQEGARVILKGTIKNHSEYKDQKQTELTRCRLTAC